MSGYSFCNFVCSIFGDCDLKHYAMIEDLKILANQRDVPYQSLLKVFLAERLEAERRLKRAG